MFKERPRGSTIARSATPRTIVARKAEQAVHDPHDARERFDPEFILALYCEKCGRAGTAPRKHVHEAVRVHAEEECPRRHVDPDTPTRIRVLYPKQ